MIWNFEVDAEHQSGFLDITFKMVCDGIKPQTKTLRVQWTGKWRSRKAVYILPSEEEGLVRGGAPFGLRETEGFENLLL